MSFNFLNNFFKCKKKMSFLALRLYKNKWQLDLIHEPAFAAPCPRVLFKWADSYNPGRKISSLGLAFCPDFVFCFLSSAKKSNLSSFSNFCLCSFSLLVSRKRATHPWVLFPFFIISAQLVNLYLNIHQ